MSTSAFSQHRELAPEVQEVRASTQIIASAGWFGDPLDRFEGRFFDGEQWTNQVSDKGVLRLDPSWATRTRSTSATKKDDFAGSERRGAHDRRQITIKVDVERRKGDRRDG